MTFNLREGQEAVKPLKLANLNHSPQKEAKKNFIELNKMRVRTPIVSVKGFDPDTSFSGRILNTIKNKIEDVSKCISKSIRS